MSRNKILFSKTPLYCKMLLTFTPKSAKVIATIRGGALCPTSLLQLHTALAITFLSL
jgi:hypothetical protein